MTDPGIVQTEHRTIILMPYGEDVRDWTFPIKPVPPTKTGRTKILPKRATVGPPDPDRDDTLSTLNLKDLSGGQGIFRLNPATDLGHSWWHVATVEGTDGWTGAREVIAAKPSAYTGNCVPVGRIGVRAYALWGTALHAWDPDAKTWGAAQQTIGTVANTEGIAYFNDKMYFPLGASGYASIAESTPGVLAAPTAVAGAATPTYSALTTPTTSPRAQMFFVHRDLLWCITTEAEGYALCNSLTGNNNDWYWPINTGRQSFIKIEKSFKPKSMAVFPNAQQQKALWVAGKGGLKVYSPDDTAWVETQLTDPPPHPDFGRAMKVFRPGEALWITAGGGDVIKYTSNGNVVPGSGPGGANEGMPADKRGSPVSWASDLAHLYGLFLGDQTVGASPSIIEDSSGGDSLYIPGAVANSTVIAQTGKGWHPVWESASTGVPTKIVVVDSTKTDGSTDYRAFWGQGENCWSMQCRLYTTSSRQSILAGMGERYMVTTIDAPDAAGYVDWGEFDGGSYAIRKLISHVGVDMNLASAVDYVEYQYYTSDSATQTWQTLGIATRDSYDGDGRTVLPFGLTADGLFSEGEACWWIRQRLRWVTTTATQPAIVRALSLAFMPLPQDAATKTYQVVLPPGGAIDTDTKQTAISIVRKLEGLVQSERFLFLQDGQTKYRAYVASVSYALANNPDAPGILNLTVLQIPTGVAGLTGED